MATTAKLLEKLAYSLRETAEVTGLSYNTVRTLVKTGKIPSVILGEKRILIPADGLRACLNKGWDNTANKKQKEGKK